MITDREREWESKESDDGDGDDNDILMRDMLCTLIHVIYICNVFITDTHVNMLKSIRFPTYINIQINTKINEQELTQTHQHVKIGKNTEESPGYVRRFAVTQTQGETQQLTLV